MLVMPGGQTYQDSLAKPGAGLRVRLTGVEVAVTKKDLFISSYFLTLLRRWGALVVSESMAQRMGASDSEPLIHFDPQKSAVSRYFL
jgi:hypothetical protein